LFRKPMKMRDLEVWGVPSYVVDIWVENYSRFLLEIQEKAVRNYGVLDYDDNNNLLVVAPTSSGKTFIGEMAAITQAVHKKKTVYLVPLRSLAEEKYRHFKDLYASCDVNTLISSRDRREYDRKIIRGDYQAVVMVYEKFNYFLLEYPDFLQEVSLVVIDEMQMINDPVRGPLLEEIITYIKKNKPGLKIIGLSAYLDNEAGFLNWISADSLLSYQRPVELRKGFVREGTFKYITHNNYSCGEETFFAADEVRDNCYEDYLEKTVSYFVKENEPTLLFFPARKDTRRWAGWLAGQIDAPRAEGAIAELSQLEETRSRNELLYLLEKGMAYHNADLSWEERNVVETYLKTGEIKLICATTTLAMGVNLPFKNVILSTSKYISNNGDYKNGYLTSMSMVDVENMGGRAGRLKQREEKGEDFGRVIFLAHSLLSETVVQNLYFNALKTANPEGIPRVNDSEGKYNSALTAPDSKSLCRPLKRGKNFANFLLKEIARGENTGEKLDNHFNELNSEFKKDGHYWVFNFEKDDLKTEIKENLERLIEYNLVDYGKKDKDKDKGRDKDKDKDNGKDNGGEKLRLTRAGILINSRRIDIDTYLLFKEYLKNKRGKLTNLELITLLTKSSEGKNIPIPFPQFNQNADCLYRGSWKGNWKYYYQKKMTELVSDRGEEGKEIYQDILGLDGEGWELDLDTEDYLSIKKVLLLYDWIGGKEIKEIEEAYKIYGGAVRKLGEGFSWLADALGGVAETLGWSKRENKKEELAGIKVVSERLAWGVEEGELGLARLHIPGLGRSYVRTLFREGYDDRKCLEELGEEELAKVVPKRLAGRIKRRFSGVLSSPPPPPSSSSPSPRTSQLNTDNRELKTVLQIDRHRPDRVIFMGKEVKLTPLAFSMLYLLAQNPKGVLSYDYLIKTIWDGSKDTTYTQVTFHLSKIRRAVLETISHNNENMKKVKEIFKVVSRRGIMLNLEEDKLKIS